MRIRSTRGITLIEMLVALVIFAIVLGATMNMLLSQSRGFSKASDELALLQNYRFANDFIRREFSAAGGNVPDQQPVVVYAGIDAFAFSADYISNNAADVSAVFIDPDAPAGHVSAMTTAQQTTIPGSLPAFVYPSVNYNDAAANPSTAETITYFFSLNAATPRTDDFVLQRQVNNNAPEIVVRNILPDSARPFFRYHYLNVPSAGRSTVDTVPTAWLPLSHSVPLHGDVADSGAAARVDSLRLVEIRYVVTNGEVGPKERTKPISLAVPLPNMGVAKLAICGSQPLFSRPVSASLAMSGVDVNLSWMPAVDEGGGENDVIRYGVFRRVVGDTLWGDPIIAIPAGNASYGFSDGGVVPGNVYEYAVTAQDCSPSSSTFSVSLPVVVP